MISQILKEKTSADHLLYVSLKYTKTCDVILNLIARWTSMIEGSFDAVLQKYVDKKKIPHMPGSPKQRIEFIKKYLKKSDIIQEVVPIYIFFRRIPELEKIRECEFRKNVNLTIVEASRITEINTDKLKEYAEIIERFIIEIKQLLSR